MMGAIIAVVVIMIAVVPVLYWRVRSARGRHVGADIIRYLLKEQGWKIGTNDDDGDLVPQERLPAVDFGDQAALLDVYDQYSCMGDLNRHPCRVFRKKLDSFNDKKTWVQVEVDLYWHWQDAGDWVNLELSTGNKGFMSGTAAEPFDSGNASFNRFFKERFASSEVARRLEAADSALDYVDFFAKKWGRALREVAVAMVVLVAAVPEEMFAESDQPKQVLEDLLADMTQLATVIETAIDPSFVRKPGDD